MGFLFLRLIEGPRGGQRGLFSSDIVHVRSVFCGRIVGSLGKEGGAGG